MDPAAHRHPADRRKHDRRSIDGIELAWGLSHRRFGQSKAASGRVINISRGGLLALVPRSRALRAGIEVPITMCGGSGRVRVVDVRSSARWGWRLCGLAVVESDDQLTESIERIITDPSGQYARTWASVR